MIAGVSAFFKACQATRLTRFESEFPPMMAGFGTLVRFAKQGAILLRAGRTAVKCE